MRSGSEGPQTSHTRSSPRVVRSGSARSGWCARGHSTRRCEGARGRLGTVPARAVTRGDVAEGFVEGHPTAWKSIECGILVLLVNRCLDRVRVANPNPHHGPGQPGWQGAALTPAARGVGPNRSKGIPSGRAMAHGAARHRLKTPSPPGPRSTLKRRVPVWLHVTRDGTELHHLPGTERKRQSSSYERWAARDAPGRPARQPPSSPPAVAGSPRRRTSARTTASLCSVSRAE